MTSLSWYECKLTEAGAKVFSQQFRYCRSEGEDAGDRVLFSDGGYCWFISSREGARKFFVVTEKLPEDISRACEENYVRSRKTS